MTRKLSTMELGLTHTSRPLTTRLMTLGAIGAVAVAVGSGLMLSSCSYPWQHSGSCTVRVAGHNAAITLSGTPDNAALTGCQDLINADSELSFGSEASGADTLCQGSVSAVDGDIQITVTDTGGHAIGNKFCQAIASYEQTLQSA